MARCFSEPTQEKQKMARLSKMTFLFWTAVQPVGNLSIEIIIFCVKMRQKISNTQRVRIRSEDGEALLPAGQQF